LLGYGDFELSPDATQLAIAVGGLSDSEVWIYRFDPDNPGEPEPVVETEASEWGPDISPDGGTERPGHLNVILNWSVDIDQ
jgi:hypothetical protein